MNVNSKNPQPQNAQSAPGKDIATNNKHMHDSSNGTNHSSTNQTPHSHKKKHQSFGMLKPKGLKEV